jgi:membrane protein
MQYLTRPLKFFFDEYKKENVVLWSAFLTYLTVLNIVPFFYFLIFISSRIPFIKSKIPTIKNTIIDVVPAYSKELLSYFDLFLKNISNLELINLAIFSVSIISLMSAFFKFTNLVYKKKVNVIKLVSYFFLSLILSSVVISVVIAAGVVLPLFLPSFANALYVKILPIFVWFVFLFSLLYISKDKSTSNTHIALSALITTILIFLLKNLLGWYFGLFTYSKIYGAVAIVPTILLWLFLFWNILLSGVIFPKVAGMLDNKKKL